MRQIILDTETTGLKPEDGHRIIELGCIELINRQRTGKHFHHYFNPEREVDAGALRVHGISNDFLINKPLFKDLVQEFVAFIDGAELIIHNAPFDLGFLQAEFALLTPSLKNINEYCRVIDTLVLARQMHPGQRNSLDALCKRYKIDNSHREFHGALLDADILASVYLSMTGGQISLFGNEIEQAAITEQKTAVKQRNFVGPLTVIKATETELAEHELFIDWLKEK
jgi:DNA polymerase-3 subunit epsilon